MEEPTTTRSMLPTFGQCDEGETAAPQTQGEPGSAVKRAVAANMLLAGLFAAGIACLWGLSLHKGPATACAEEMTVETTVDTALSQLTPSSGKSSKETAAVLDTFYYEARHRQLPQGRLKGNPFILTMPVRAVAAPTEATPTPAPTPVVASNTAACEALAAAAKLSLQSVLMGNHETVAMISNNLLTEGQTIQGWTVSKIEPREVTLTWNDQKYVLHMAE